MEAGSRHMDRKKVVNHIRRRSKAYLNETTGIEIDGVIYMIPMAVSDLISDLIAQINEVTRSEIKEAYN